MSQRPQKCETKTPFFEVLIDLISCLDVDVSDSRDTPKSSILIGVFHYKPSILKHPYFLETPMWIETSHSFNSKKQSLSRH